MAPPCADHNKWAQGSAIASPSSYLALNGGNPPAPSDLSIGAVQRTLHVL